MKDLSKRTAIIVLNWNKPEMTMECLESLQMMWGEYDIFVVDNGSDKDKKDKLIDEMKKRSAVILAEQTINDLTLDDRDGQLLLLILLDKNYGYAKGNNYGLRLAYRLGYKYSLISNNDVKIIDKNVLVELIKGIESDPKYAWAGPKVLIPDGREQGPNANEEGISKYFFAQGIFYPVYVLFFRNKVHNQRANVRNGHLEPFWIAGCFMLLKNEAAYEVDFFDENTFLNAEEPILGEKFHRLDYHLKHVSSVNILHNQKKGVKFDFKLEHFSINSHLYYWKNYKNCSQLLCYLAKLSHIFWIYVFYKPVISKYTR
ncbi:MAG: glycosyltransferase [Thermotogae bacterium]|nr:glycosyltransferase [Thermotogota bacterium]